MLLKSLIAEGIIDPALIISKLEDTIEIERSMRDTNRQLNNDREYFQSVDAMSQLHLLISVLRCKSESLP
jgi:hypothetical protein